MQQTSEKGFKISLYLLLVLTKRIAKVFNSGCIMLWFYCCINVCFRLFFM
ncbi:hypothetical protein Hanom_Chr00s000006g01614071 [Helianthus anomalus]